MIPTAAPACLPGRFQTPALRLSRLRLLLSRMRLPKNAYFFVTDLKGSYYYAHTLSEHNANCKTAAAVNKSMNTEK